jgi:GH15 family glucan-1,4-alpha-glucosidase
MTLNDINLKKVLDENDYALRIGQSVIKSAESLGWNREDSEDASTFLMRHCREVAFEDSASANWNKFIRHLNENHPLLAKYGVDKKTRKRVMVSSEPWVAFCGSIDWYRDEFLKANGS